MKKGYITSDVRQNSRELFEKIWNGHSDKVKGLDVDKFLEALTKDKKNKGLLLGLILNKGYGKVFKDFTENDMKFRTWIEEYFTNELNVGALGCNPLYNSGFKLWLLSALI